MSGHPDWAYAAALTQVPGCGSTTAFRLLVLHEPREAYERALAEAASHGANAQGDAVGMMRERCEGSGVGVAWVRGPGFPLVIAAGPGPCGVFFFRGDAELFVGRRVGIVGTRTPTPSGVYTAREIGEGLSRAGVHVVSGLAKGIDGAAHDGVRAAVESSATTGRAIAVVGSGLDVVYPRTNAALWEWVAHHGLLISEHPPGATAEAHHFPRRNRLIAALSEVVVVVESRESGGSMSTVRHAIERQRDVLAVPGSPRVVSAAGTNLLIQQGCGAVTSAADILSVLALDHRHIDVVSRDERTPPDPRDVGVLEACSHGPVTLDQLMIATACTLADLALSLGRLEATGWVVEEAGWWEALLLRRGRHKDECIS
ncbi:MAG: DNA-processing protein DprA [Actinobacteria bacterium]|nr:DNA-processing protein DprA [Actinomycetota bacterium]